MEAIIIQTTTHGLQNSFVSGLVRQHHGVGHIQQNYGLENRKGKGEGNKTVEGQCPSDLRFPPAPSKSLSYESMFESEHS